MLTLIIYGCLGGCSPQQPEEHPDPENRDPLGLVINHLGDSTSIVINEHVYHTLDYTSIPYTNHDLSIGIEQLYIPPSVNVVYLTTGMTDQLTNEEVERLIRFVAEGNQLIILTPVFDDRIAYLMGLKNDTSYEIDQAAEGYHFHKDIFPEYKGHSLETMTPFLHQAFKGSEFITEKNILASAVNDTSYPAITERKIGLGSSVYFNTRHVEAKDYRGLLFSAGLRALEGLPYRIANVSTIFLDDFPAPLYDSKLPPIDEEYDISHAEFVQSVWWPEMKALADSFDINYTAMLTFNYNATVVPPFNFDEWEGNKFTIGGITQNTSSWLANDINSSRHELGFHGYNHFSLWLKDWQNRGFMEAALRAARKRWTINSPGTLPQSYVPPTNEIDSLGLVSIERAFPEIKYMSSLYNGDVEDGGGREFGPDPYVPSLFNYPRITSGFVDNETSRFNQNSLFLYSGIWTHFIHPDDVFQVMQRAEDNYRSRNPLGLGWHSNQTHDYGLYEVFQQRLEKAVNTYPYIRFKTVSQSIPIVESWLNTQSNYHFNDSTLHISTQVTKPEARQNGQKFWLAYVSNNNRRPFEQSLSDSEIEFASSDLWDGRLYQFSTTSDTLVLPVLNAGSLPGDSDDEVARILEHYRAYAGLNNTDKEPRWIDTRFEDAVAALKKNPSSKGLQDKVIDLAIEFDSIETAISVLEQRLMDQPQWSTRDIRQLLKFYGWEGQPDKAFSFLEQLWTKFSDQSIIMLKNMVVEQYGVPSDDFQKKWTERALSLEPENESLLVQVVRLHYSSDSWPKRKQYIKRLIDLNPRSDTLYHFALDNSMAYESARGTLEWLRDFPAEAAGQLQPLAPDIAYMYASEGELTRAIIWGQRTEKIPAVTELDWLLQQKRYHDFLNRSTILMEKEPQNDSLHAFVGQQLIYENFRKEGFSTLYPLFEQDRATPQTKELVHSEIGYMDFEQKKQFYHTYPDFFPDSLRVDLDHAYRKNEGVEVGTSTSFASDNFDNEIAAIGLFAAWGNRPELTHRISMEEKVVASDILGNDNFNNLYHLNYRYQRSYRDQTMQSFVGGGAYLDEQEIRPDLQTGFWFSKDSSFTSATLQFEPVFTNRGIQRNINQLTATVYREDYWLKSNGLQTALSLTGNWYSNDVFEYETLSRFYINLPFSTNFSKLRPVADLSYSDATESYRSGVPYYTPDNLFTKGGGIDYSYRDKLYDPNFSTGITLMVKHDNRDGAFFSGSARLSARINKYWQLSLEGELSTSSVYRYNNAGLTISYLLPKTFTE